MAITDTCIYLEAVSGDGGTHATTGVWWLSPDVIVKNLGVPVDPVPSPGPNTVEVRVHKKSGCTVALEEGEGVAVDVFVGDPSLTMTRTSGTTKITNSPGPPPRPTVIESNPNTLPVAGKVISFSWTLTGTGQETAGHKCLVAQCYREISDSPGANFGLPAEQHVVQHNLCIINCGSKMGKAAGNTAKAMQEGCSLNVSTNNLNLEEAEKVTLRLVPDINPGKVVLDAALPLLKKLPGFQDIATNAPEGFGLRLPDFPDAIVRDNTRPGCLGRFLGRIFPPLREKFLPRYEADIQMKPGQFTTFTFVPNVGNLARGQAHIYHITHVGADQRVYGGLTAVVLNL